MRLRSDIWVSAYLRRCAVEGAYATLRRRGAAEAGAIFVLVDHLDGRVALFGPAPQTAMVAGEADRLWARTHAQSWIAPPEAEERLRKELRFDSDLWIVDVDDRDGRSFLDLAPAEDGS
jgi:hypothetical protein